MINPHSSSVLELPVPLNEADEPREDVSDKVGKNPSAVQRVPATSSGLRREWQVLAFVAVTLLSVECGMRVLESRLSKDLLDIRSFPEIAATLSDPLHADDQRILFLGNSLTRDGVDVEAVTGEMTRLLTDSGVFVRKAMADGTGLAEWFYAFRNQFAKTGHTPDIVVLGFEGSGGGHIGDARTFDPSALGYLFSEFSDIPDVMQHELPESGEHCDFLLGSVSSAYANRKRVQRRVLDAIIPGYRDMSMWINAAIVSRQPRPSTKPVAPTFTRLARFIDLAEAHGVQVVLVAIPVPVPVRYEIPAELTAFSETRSISLIDARHLKGIDDTMFPDGLHMNAVAAKRFSRHVASELAGQIKMKQH
jgi:lysophospholipase L1-like esterase